MTEQVSSFSSLSRYANVLRRQWWLVGLVVVLALGTAALYMHHKRSVYASQMKIVVGQGQALFVPDLSNAVQPFTQTMTDLIKSNVVAQQTIERLHLDITPTVLISHMSASSPPEASVLELTYEDTNRTRATQVLATIGQVFTELVNKRLDASPVKRTPKATTGAAEAISAPVSATVFDPAHSEPDRISPKPTRTYIIALILGLIAGTLLAFMRDALASRIRNEDEAHETFRVPVVGSLPRGTIGTTPAQAALIPEKLSMRLIEVVEVLAATLRYSGSQAESGVILVVSAQPQEGKSTVASQLSASLASTGNSVALVDADMRQPSMPRFFQMQPRIPGLGDVLAGDIDLSAALYPAPVTERRDGELSFRSKRGRDLIEDDHLTARGGNPKAAEQDVPFVILPAGTQTHNPAQVLSLGGAAQLVTQLRKRASYVIFDTPPLLVSGDAFPLVQLADLVLVICREGQTTRQHGQALRERLNALGVHDFYVVLTEASAAQRKPYGYGYGSKPDVGRPAREELAG